MASVNQCNFIGNLGSDVSLRYTNSGQAVGNVNMAVTEKYKDQEKTEWVRLVFWGKSAETVEKYAGKGSSLFVSGRLQTRQWEKDGSQHYTTEIVVSNFQFLGGNRKDGAGQGQTGQNGKGGQGQSRQQSYNQGPGPGQGQQDHNGQFCQNQSGLSDDSSDIPF